jgi:hypothetical protein
VAREQGGLQEAGLPVREKNPGYVIASTVRGGAAEDHAARVLCRRLLF